jgi:S1-C subfamily serine protease
MTSKLLIEFSAEVEALAGAAAPFLVHIGGDDIPFRTGLVWDEHHLVAPAVFARDGEEVTALGADGKDIPAVVQAFDHRNGLALLRTETALRAPGWSGEAPRLGALAVSVAYPSPAGAEARLDLVRCVGDGYFQTDGPAFPGFGGAAVIGPSGKLWGMVLVNAAGNRGYILPFETLKRTVEELATTGSRRRRVLGVRTQEAEGGVLVTEVAEDSAAREAGILVGDILVKMGDTALTTPYDLYAALEKGEKKYALTLTRGGESKTVAVEPRETQEGGGRWRASHCCGR